MEILRANEYSLLAVSGQLEWAGLCEGPGRAQLLLMMNIHQLEWAGPVWRPGQAQLLLMMNIHKLEWVGTVWRPRPSPAADDDEYSSAGVGGAGV